MSVFHKIKFNKLVLEGYPGSSDSWESAHLQLSCKDKQGHEVPGRFDMVLVASDLIPKKGEI